MSAFDTPGRARRPPKQRTRRPLRALAVVAALVLAFLLGVAFSRALDERPRPGADVTTVRTVSLLPDEATATVTETVTTP